MAKLIKITINLKKTKFIFFTFTSLALSCIRSRLMAPIKSTEISDLDRSKSN